MPTGRFVGALNKKASWLWRLTSLPVPVIFKVPQVSIAAVVSYPTTGAPITPNSQRRPVSPKRSLLSVCAWEARLEPWFRVCFY